MELPLQATSPMHARGPTQSDCESAPPAVVVSPPPLRKQVSVNVDSFHNFEELRHVKADEFSVSSFRKRIVFDAIGVQFHISVFLWQLLVHIFVFLAPLLKNPAGQGFARDNLVAWRFNVLPPVLIYLMMVFLCLCPSSDRVIITNYVYLTLMFFFVHRFIVALKYATLSETEYSRFCNCGDVALSREYLNQTMFFAGWYLMQPEVLAFELGAASARMGERINHIHLIVAAPGTSATAFTQFQYWNAFLRGQEYVFHDSAPAPELKPLPCGNYALSVYDMCAAVIRSSQKAGFYIGAVNLSIDALVFLLIVWSLVPIAMQAHKLQNPALVTAFLLCSFLSMWIYGRVFFKLLNIVTFDCVRQLRMVSIQHCMIRLTELMMHAKLSVASTVSNCSESYAQDRVTAILSMHEVKPIHCCCGCDGCDPMACTAFYASSPGEGQRMDDIAETGGVPHVEGAAEEDALFPTAVLADGPGDTDARLEGETASRATVARATAVRRRPSAALGERFADESSCARVPRITFEFPQNVLAWTYARLTIQNFGDRFRFRMDCYIAVTMALALLLMIHALGSIAQSTDRVATVTSAFFVQTLVITTMLVAYLVVHCSCAAAVNKEVERQRRTLGARKLRAISCMNRHVSGCTETLERIVENIDTAIESAELNEELKPFRIFGMVAQDALTISVLTTAMSFYSVVFSMVFYQKGVAASL